MMAKNNTSPASIKHHPWIEGAQNDLKRQNNRKQNLIKWTWKSLTSIVAYSLEKNRLKETVV